MPNFILPSYTFESILFKDINKLAQLLVIKYEIDDIKINIDEIKNKLETNYLDYKDILFERYHDEKIDKSSGFPSYKDYRGRYITPSQNMFDLFIKIEDVPLSNKLKKYYKQTIQNRDFFKLMNKTDVENIINQSLSEYSITFDIESDFYTLVQLINNSNWYEEFNFLKQI
ncbi:hypothetical protein JJC04_16665 [Flavobacterium covae]|nr:hypothetical protein [Flavobacterium covae]QYS91306.1 hypothetical protein JJC04_16665 [Flavobacterium covae]